MKVKFGEVAKQRKEFIVIDDDKEYKLCRVKLHRKGVLLRNIQKGISIKTKKQQVCKEGDFIVAEIDAKVGGYGFIPQELDGAIVSSHYYLFEIDENKLLKKFLDKLIKTEIIQEQIKAQGSTNYSSIRPKDVLNLEIPLPSIEDQKKTIKKLEIFSNSNEFIFNEIENQETYIKQLRQAILQEAVQGKLVPQDPNDEPASELLKKIKAEKEKLIKEGKIKKEKPLPPISESEIPYNLPQGWMWCRFIDIANIASNLVNPNDYSNLPHIAPNNIQKETGKLLDYNTISEDKVFSSKHYFYKNQILYSKIRPNLSKVITINFEGLCSADMYPIKSFIDRFYLHKYMLSSTFLGFSVKNDTRVAMPKINQEELNKILVPVPPIEEQERIVQKVDELMKFCDELEHQIKQSKTHSEQLMQSILKEAFNSKHVEELARV